MFYTDLGPEEKRDAPNGQLGIWRQKFIEMLSVQIIF